MRSTIVLCLALSACVDQPDLTDDSAQLGASGRQRFEHVFAGTNGRSCASCHVLSDATSLTPAHVASLDRSDPLFQRIDADDPSAAVPTYRHLEKGLIRVTLALPPNMDVIDGNGNVVTNAARTIDVWRGVPTVENVAYSGPTFQLDGRETNLRAQAQSAITAHAQGGTVAQAHLSQIEQFELATFSSARAAFVATLAQAGVEESDIPMPEDWLVLSNAERRGRAVFDKACAACHGGATTHRITNRAVHDQLFFQLHPDGNIIYDIVGGQPVPRLASRPTDEFLNIGIGLLSGYGQLGALPIGNADVELPRYRFRFYTDGSRQTAVTDLPPIPRRADGTPVDLGDLNVPVDERGAPIFGPSLGVQWFSTDPGRAIITGDPVDFEAFDVPQLRGIARTAPYFHDNQAATLADVADTYSRFILPFPALGLPPIYRDSPDSPFVESLTLAEKQDLVAFLQRL
ncbi:MAG: cytochrome-c peroxidase [Kofleriaceae bacterium]|nr:cytochrome-c peroxidase [Kofleriaceae bacterium]